MGDWKTEAQLRVEDWEEESVIHPNHTNDLAPGRQANIQANSTIPQSAVGNDETSAASRNVSIQSTAWVEGEVSGNTENVSSCSTDAIPLETRPSNVILETRDMGDYLRNHPPYYKPLPSIPPDLKLELLGTPPPAYETLSFHQMPTNQQAAHGVRLNVSRPCPIHNAVRDGRHLDSELGQGITISAMSTTDYTVSKMHTLLCSFFACLCPLIGWIPLALACVVFQTEKYIPSEHTKQSLRRMILLMSTFCIIIGLIMSAGFVLKCKRSGTCEGVGEFWKWFNIRPTHGSVRFANMSDLHI